MAKTDDRRAARVRRHVRIRKNIAGTASRPRLAVFRSNIHIYAQIIDDRAGVTLASASTSEKDFVTSGEGKIGAAKVVGQLLAERAKAAGVTSVVFDRGGNRFAGRVAALAESARENGLEF